jgi:hypothetical protein
MHCKLYLFAAVFCCFIPTAFADLISSTPFEVPINGTGFGNVSTLITLQTANGQTSAEAGCIGFGNSTTNCGIATDGKIKNTSTTQPVPTGITSAGNLRFVFNASEPGGSSITLTQFEISFYGNSTTPIFTAHIASPVTLTSTLSGTGNSGFVFQIAPNELGAANAVLASTTAIGAGFTATNASGGQDTVFLETVGGGGTTQSAVPEPTIYGLFGIGLVGTFLARRSFVRSRTSQLSQR